MESVSVRRNLPGTKDEVTFPFHFTKSLTTLQDMFAWLPRTFEAIESPFALQEYIQELVRVDRNNIPLLLDLPSGQDTNVWQYEQLRYAIFEALANKG